MPDPGGSPELSPAALRVLRARYLRRDAAGAATETPDELFARVARGVAEAELRFGSAKIAETWERRFHAMLLALEFLPNSPTLMNAGTALGQLAACFALPVDDTMEGIFGALRGMALVQRTGGGTGFSFSHLRPKGDLVRSTGGEASGPVSFMRVFDCATENIRQGGRRRGANMGVLRVDHPDVLDFVRAKLDGSSLTNFNLSVGVTDAFMRAALGGGRYDLVHPATGAASGRVAAAEVLDAIVEAAWRTGDPGLVFLDAVNRANPTPALGAIETTNPCGEVPLLPYESCVLGSINVARLVRADAADLDWPRLAELTRTAVRFLDDVVEVSRDPLPEIGVASRGNRKIGLGIMGFAEGLIRLGVAYDSPAAIAWADRLMSFVAREAHDASHRLADERGPFPSWGASRHADGGVRVRNATCLSIAPTGTLSIIAGTSGGIEPLFALAYRRAHTLGGAPMLEVNPVCLRALEESGLPRERWLAGLLERGTLRDVAGVPEALRRRLVTATEIPPAHHLRIQAAFQRHVDNAVSKTINLPQEASADDVRDAYVEAWRLGVKGTTVYRSGSRASQVLTLGLGEEAEAHELYVRCDPGACRL